MKAVEIILILFIIVLSIMAIEIFVITIYKIYRIITKRNLNHNNMRKDTFKSLHQESKKGKEHSMRYEDIDKGFAKWLREKLLQH